MGSNDPLAWAATGTNRFDERPILIDLAILPLAVPSQEHEQSIAAVNTAGQQSGLHYIAYSGFDDRIP